MKTQTLRVIIPVVLALLIGLGFAFNLGFGTLSAFGWEDISILCPLGALMSMLAAHTILPRPLISLVIVVVLIILFARAFCGWMCPVPVVSKLRGAFTKKTSNTDLVGCGVDLERANNHVKEGCQKNCAGCKAQREKLDSRHVILGGSLITAAIFGFPVFCLICPIGLTFASIFLISRLFAFGDVSWTVLVVPVLLILEVVVFRKWCSKICPISALMSLVGKANKTFVPVVNHTTCIEHVEDGKCEVCASVCPEGINPRHPELGASWSECTKCRACVEACPTHSITMPFLPQKGEGEKVEVAPASSSQE